VGGGFLGYRESEVLLAQCTFWANVGRRGAQNDYRGGGGGVYVGEYDPASDESPSSLWMINCSVCWNTCFGGSETSATGAGVAIGLGAEAVVQNSILWGNYDEGANNPHRVETYQIMATSEEGGAWWYKNYDRIDMSYSFVGERGQYSGGYFTGRGNLGTRDTEAFDFEPKFINGESGNLSLKSDSPCIDAGDIYVDYDPLTLFFQLLPDEDLAGQGRVVDGDNDGVAVVDMGAYEQQGGG